MKLPEHYFWGLRTLYCSKKGFKQVLNSFSDLFDPICISWRCLEPTVQSRHLHRSKPTLRSSCWKRRKRHYIDAQRVPSKGMSFDLDQLMATATRTIFCLRWRRAVRPPSRQSESFLMTIVRRESYVLDPISYWREGRKHPRIGAMCTTNGCRQSFNGHQKLYHPSSEMKKDIEENWK